MLQVTIVCKRKAVYNMKKRIMRVLCGIVLCLLFSGCGKTSYLESMETFEDEAEFTSQGDIEEAGFTDQGGTADSAGKEPAESVSENDSNEEAQPIYVQAAGAVKAPGVYKLPSGSRVFELIEQAGGLLKNADEADLNQAEELSDGEKVLVLTKKEAKRLRKGDTSAVSGGGEAGSAGVSASVSVGAGRSAPGSAAESGGLVDLNQASADDLKTLPGIGDAKAADIIAYREANGSFGRIEDIMQVPGIADGTFNRIKDRITV